MQFNNWFFPIVGAAFATLVTVEMPLVRAEPIVLINPSFESPTRFSGGYIENVTGWSIIDNGTGDTGVYNPLSASFGFVPDGAQTLYSNGGIVFQTLTRTLAPNTVYTLGVFVGRRLDTAFPGFTVELRAGGTVLASANETNIPLPTPGNFERLTLTYVSPSSNVATGQLLEIRLKSNSIQTNFDFVTLDAHTFSPR